MTLNRFRGQNSKTLQMESERTLDLSNYYHFEADTIPVVKDTLYWSAIGKVN
jgi:hypothetical protein